MADPIRAETPSQIDSSDSGPLSPQWFHFPMLGNWQPSAESSPFESSVTAPLETSESAAAGLGAGGGLDWFPVSFDDPIESATNSFGSLRLDQQRSSCSPHSPEDQILQQMNQRQNQTSALGMVPTDPNLPRPGSVTHGSLERVLHSPHMPLRNRAVRQLKLRRTVGTSGRNIGDFNSPLGFCIGLREEILVADTNNHRIQIFNKDGKFKRVFGIEGKENGFLWLPRKVGVLKGSGCIVVCDRGKGRSRLQIFHETGYFLKCIQIGYIEIVSGLGITSQDKIALVDSVRPAIYIFDPVNGNQLKNINLQRYILEPSDMAIFNDEFLICDYKGHQVLHVSSDGMIKGKIGTELFSKFPNGIDVSDAGDILIIDSHGNKLHVAVFNSNQQFLCHYECPTIQVSRCCGLRILSDGHIVTLSKNNDNVLILDTIYV